jgi:DNA-binding transcriptional ArsR family regulator
LLGVFGGVTRAVNEEVCSRPKDSSELVIVATIRDDIMSAANSDVIDKLARITPGDLDAPSRLQKSRRNCSPDHPRTAKEERARHPMSLRDRLLREGGIPSCFSAMPPVIYNQMVVDTILDEETDRLFRALADSTRRDILQRAIAHEQSVSSLADRYDMSFAAVQKHVAVLERAALVTKERRGREQIVHGHEPTLQKALRLLTAYELMWVERANQMASVLVETKGVTRAGD